MIMTNFSTVITGFLIGLLFVGSVEADVCDNEYEFLSQSFVDGKNVDPCTELGGIFLYSLDEDYIFEGDGKDVGPEYYFYSRELVRVILDEEPSDEQKLTAILGLFLALSEMNVDQLPMEKKETYHAFLIGRFWEITDGGGGERERKLLWGLMHTTLSRSSVENYKQASCVVKFDWPGLAVLEIKSSVGYRWCEEQN